MDKGNDCARHHVLASDGRLAVHETWRHSESLASCCNPEARKNVHFYFNAINSYAHNHHPMLVIFHSMHYTLYIFWY